MATILFLIIGLVLAYFAATFIRNQFIEPRKPLPPGPKGLPIVGNIFDLPKPGVPEPLHWLEHKKTYGPISSVSLWGQPIIIINDAQVAIELLEKRSMKHASRPRLVYAGEMVGWEKVVLLTPYNRRLRAMRKDVVRVSGSHSSLVQCSDAQMAETARLLLLLLESPDNFVSHIKKSMASTMLKLVFGYKADYRGDDILITALSNVLKQFSRIAVPGAVLVDNLPFLKYIPDWMPGTAWKKDVSPMAAELLGTVDLVDAFVRKQMAQGIHERSFLSEMYEAANSNSEEEDISKWTCFTLYAGGTDTLVAFVEWFILAMTMYPEVQRRAHEEIDRVIGKDRLPVVEDRENLPYINAIVRETFRWRPALPMGFWHQSSEDDVYDGYYIPKGSILLANIWEFTHDPNVHSNANDFQPERFLAIDGHEPEMDTYKHAFGFGRRICAGMNLADQEMFLVIAQTLALFDFTKRDGDTLDAQSYPGVTVHPVPFKSKITPRSPHHEEMIRSLEKVYPWQQSDRPILEQIVKEKNLPFKVED